MKKIALLTLVLACLCSVVGCGDKKATAAPTQTGSVTPTAAR